MTFFFSLKKIEEGVVLWSENTPEDNIKYNIKINCMGDRQKSNETFWSVAKIQVATAYIIIGI